jgi:flavodoxin
MKALVVFYSYDGNTRFIAEAIAKAARADRLELTPRNEMKSWGALKYLRGGLAVLARKRPELLPLDRDPMGYDVVFVGSPVWAGTFAPAMRAFLATSPLSGRKIALFCCCGGGKGRIFKSMREALIGNDVLAEKDFVDPLKHTPDLSAAVAEEWALCVMKAAGA